MVSLPWQLLSKPWSKANGNGEADATCTSSALVCCKSNSAVTTEGAAMVLPASPCFLLANVGEVFVITASEPPSVLH